MQAGGPPARRPFPTPRAPLRPPGGGIPKALEKNLRKAAPPGPSDGDCPRTYPIPHPLYLYLLSVFIHCRLGSEREHFAAPSRRRAFTRGPSASASPAIQRRRACADNGALRRGQPAVVQDQPVAVQPVVVQDQPVAVQDQPVAVQDHAEARQDQPVAIPWQVLLFSRLLECLTALAGPRQRPPS